MIREATLRGNAAAKDPIRWRGREVSRLEALTDGMFAIAITLLVVSVDIPKSFDVMMTRMSGFLAFGFCFAMMVWVWSSHNMFCRRFGLIDGWTTVLTFSLVFVVLFFVYPLKFAAASFVVFIQSSMHMPIPGDGPTFKVNQLPTLFVIYGLGFVAIFLLLGLMYRHAYKCRDFLALSALEMDAVRHEWIRCFGVSAIGGLSVVIALGTGSVFLAGMTYWLIGVVEWWHAHQVGKLNSTAGP